MLDGGPKVEPGRWEAQPFVHLGSQGPSVPAGQVPPHPPVHDPAIFLRGEIDAVGELAVPEVHPGSQGLEHTPAGVLLARVVAEDGEHRDVRLGGHVRTDRVHQALGAVPHQVVQDRRPGRLQGGSTVQLGHGVVTEPVEADVEELARAH